MEHPRRCPGPVTGKSCGAFLSKPEVDPHSLCSLCRGKVCSPTTTCPECESWTEIQWILYGTKKKKAAKKSPKRANVSSSLVSPDASSERGSLPPSPTQSRGRGASATGGDAEKAGTSNSDPVAWDPPRTPFRSPMRLEEEFDAWFDQKKVPWSPPAPSSTLPLVFLQPSSPENRRGVPPMILDDSGDSADSLSSSSSSSSLDSSSSEDEGPKSSKRKREKSHSRSRHSRKRSKTSKKKSKRSRSSNDKWVTITVPRSELFRATSAAATSGWLPRASSSPSRPYSSSRSDLRQGTLHQASLDDSKATKVPASSAQRREALLRTEGLASSAATSAVFSEHQGRPSCLEKPTATGDPAGQGRPMTDTLVPADPPILRAGPSIARQEKKPPPFPRSPSRHRRVLSDGGVGSGCPGRRRRVLIR
ncbi:serine/arginine-rich splicing factor 4-like [Palaemon carinicauda]|uniref:serine/arginine-rich splicing factor 4-like n=1 Tax=Palaemon carinicauda TaxID=392227 RepID=UPI0035B6A8BE